MKSIMYCGCCKEVTDLYGMSLEIADKLLDVFMNGRDYELDLYRRVMSTVTFKSDRKECYRCMPDAHERPYGI